jgi:hypothetical protein
MNRSILIVICDFLLVSLLAFSTVDINKVSDNAAERQLRVEIATNQVESGKDLTAVMRTALTEERRNRDLLMGELQKSRETLVKQQGLLSDREKQVQSFQQEVQSREQAAAQLQQEQKALQERFASALTNIQTLNQQLQSTSSEAVSSREKLSAMEAELKRRAQEAAALQQQMNDLSKSNQTVLNEKQQLASQLQVAQVETRHAREQAVSLQQEVKVEREEKAKLAEGVKALASKSGELTQEIRENRPLAPNTIFNEFVTNRVEARFNAVRSGAFGFDSSKRRDTETVLVTDGTNTFALCHVQDTPLSLTVPGTDWISLTGTLSRGAAGVSVHSISFYLRDPRIALIPVSKAEARQLGGKVYSISSSPYKFQDAVLVGAREGYYGECRFEIDLSTPEYVRLDRSFFKGLFGKFNPSRGDLVFAKTGELLGIMSNDSYCLMIRNFDAGASFQFGPDVRAQHTGEILSQLYGFVVQLPAKLQ